MGGDFRHRVFGADAFAFADQALHLVEVGVDLVGGGSGQEVGIAAATTGCQGQGAGGSQGQGKEKWAQSRHRFESKERP